MAQARIEAPPETRGARSLGRILLSCFVTLLLAQLLTGALTLSSLQRLYREASAAKVEVIGLEAAGKLETSIRFGKSLSQFLGIAELLREVNESLPEVDEAAILVADGTRLGVEGRGRAPPELLAALLTPVEAAKAGSRSGNSLIARHDGHRYLILPVKARDGSLAGALSLRLNDAAIDAAARPGQLRNAALLIVATLAAVLGISIGFAILLPDGDVRRLGRLQLLALPLLGVVLAQGIYALETASTFRATYLEVTRATLQSLGERVQRDIDGLLARGIALEGLSRIDAPLARLARSFPEIASIDLSRPDGGLISRTTARGAVPVSPGMASADGPAVTLPLRADRAGGPALGTLAIRVDTEVIAEGVRRRVLDAATIALISAIMVTELFFLFTLLLKRSLERRQAGPDDTAAKLARPLIFSFLFAWALPLSFLPLHARALPAAVELPPNLLMALPISAEMLGALATALLAGALTDRRGWHLPVLGGLFLSVLGAVGSSLAPNLESFTLARGVVGLGYGLAWMGIQGFVVAVSAPTSRAENLATLIAGIFAGHLSGSAIGALLSEHLGTAAVFTVGAGVLTPTLVGVILLLRDRALPRRPALAALRVAAGAERNWVRLVASRDFGALLAGSVIPFSVVQVGLLYFALPISLEAQGVPAADVGRILMAYGLCAICLGPSVGRLVDRAPNKRLFIPLGGLAGGGGLAYLYLDSSLPAIIAAVFLLSLAGCLVQAAQSSYALALPRVQSYGPGFAFGVQRAADKLGQMLGPLVIGLMIAAVGTANGLAIVGLSYLTATLVFFLVTPRTTAGEAAEAPALATEEPLRRAA